MKVLLDENISPKLAQALRARGHDAVHVSDWGMVGQSDRAIYQRATADKRAVITRDADFLALHRESKGMGAGVLHLPQGATPNRPAAQDQFLREHESQLRTVLERHQAARLDRGGLTRVPDQRTLAPSAARATPDRSATPPVRPEGPPPRTSPSPVPRQESPPARDRRQR